MKKLKIEDVHQYVEANISAFHQKRIDGLSNLKLPKVLKRKNPYLYKAKNIGTASEIVSQLVAAHFSSQEETIFGDWLEGLAVFISERVADGRKSGIEGIDLEFDNNGVRYIVTIKSGPHWGNASQIKKMKERFVSATKTLRTSNSKLNVIAVNGCCYGADRKPTKDGYLKLCGQDFWEFISGEKNLFVDIIEPLGFKAKEWNEEFRDKLPKVINIFSLEFLKKFCESDGQINWERLVRFNSGK